jgi:GT2 family glycosyltransferase
MIKWQKSSKGLIKIIFKKMANQLSIIYVSFQSQEDLKRSLRSLKNISDCSNYEIIVVVNDDETLDLENIQLIKNPTNVGFAGACNVGARAANGEILWFLNPDTEIKSDKLAGLLQKFQNNSVGIVGPKIVLENGNIQPWLAGYFPSLGGLIRNNLGFSRDKKIWNSRKKINVDWVSGTSLFIRKKLFDELEGFDENFFMYFEDIDLCRRAAEKGSKIIYYPEFIVKHFGGKSFQDNKLQKNYYYASQDYYFKKHLGNYKKNIVKLMRKFSLPNL